MAKKDSTAKIVVVGTYRPENEAWIAERRLYNLPSPAVLCRKAGGTRFVASANDGHLPFHEAEELARKIRKKVHGNRGPNMDKSLPESWYGVIEDYDNGEPLIVCERIYDSPPAFQENMDDKRRRVASWRGHFIEEEIKILDAEEFFDNEEYAEYPENIREVADQARFAAETIRRINANGRFARMIMG